MNKLMAFLMVLALVACAPTERQDTATTKPKEQGAEQGSTLVCYLNGEETYRRKGDVNFRFDAGIYYIRESNSFISYTPNRGEECVTTY